MVTYILVTDILWTLNLSPFSEEIAVQALQAPSKCSRFDSEYEREGCRIHCCLIYKDEVIRLEIVLDDISTNMEHINEDVEAYDTGK